MVSYGFENSEQNDEAWKWNLFHHISRFKVLKHIFFTLILGGNVFYVQYLLFYKNETSEDYLSLNYLTMMVIYFISAAINMTFSVRMFIIYRDARNFTTMVVVSAIFITINTYFSTAHSMSDSNSTSLVFKVAYTLIFTPLFLFLQVTTFLRHVFVTKYAIQFRLTEDEEMKKEFYELMVHAEADAGLISILDCYLRAAPQLIAQIAIILYSHGDFKNISFLQLASIFIALVMMPWSVTSFQGALRIQQNKSVPWITKMVYFSWHFCIMASRISSVAAAMAFWPMHTGAAIFLHCTVTTIWLWRTTPPMDFYNRNQFWHFLFCCVFGGVYFFNPVNLVDRPTRWKYFWFYVVLCVENIVANVMWYLKEDKMLVKYKIMFVVFNAVGFFTGIGFMIIYYKKMHPNKISENDQIMDYESLNMTEIEELEDTRL